MPGPILGLAWALSAAILLVPSQGPGGLWLAPGARTALCLLPWVALVGLPGGAQHPRRGGGEQVVAAALLLAPLALALSLDRASGAPLAVLARIAATGLGCFALLGAAASRGRSAYASGWFAAVAALPLLAAVLGWDGAPGGSTPAWLAWAAAASPLGWLYAAAAPALASVHPLQPLAWCCALLALAFAGNARPRRREQSA